MYDVAKEPRRSLFHPSSDPLFYSFLCPHPLPFRPLHLNHGCRNTRGTHRAAPVAAILFIPFIHALCSPPLLSLSTQMAADMKAKEIEGDAVKVHRIRITLTSRNVKNLEKGAHRHPFYSRAAFSLPAWQRVPHANHRS